jgi:hypothetical protein
MKKHLVNKKWYGSIQAEKRGAYTELNGGEPNTISLAMKHCA